MPPHIIIGLDPGTRYMAIAAQFVRDDRVSPQSTPINTIYLPNGEEVDNPDIKQIVVFLDDDKGQWTIIWGKHVPKVIRDNPRLQDQSLEFFKLALHPSFGKYMEVAHVKKILNTERDRGRLQDLYSDPFEDVVKLVRDFYRDRVSDMDINDVPVTMQICVPVMWEDEQRGIVRNAAKEAKVTKAELREEPLCSAVMCTRQLLEYGAIQVGQCSLIVDCGAGTLDISVTRLDQVPSHDQEMVLTRIAICSGNGAGSHMLNHQLLTCIIRGQCPGVPNFKGLCAKMETTEHDILRQASEQFDQTKKDFPGTLGYYPLNLYGDSNAEVPFHTIHLPHNLVQEWYDAWVAAATPLLRDHIARVTAWAEKHGETLDLTHATFSGGGMRSSLFASAMEQVLKESKYKLRVEYARSRLPCAQGALQHHIFQEDALPPRMRFFTALDEVYTEKLHGKKAKRKGSKYANNVKIADDRLFCILKYDNGTFNSQRMAAMSFLVPAKDLGRLHVDIYWSENDFDDSDALRDHTGKVRKGIRAFPLAWTDIPNLGDNGFQQINNHGTSGTYYQVHGWVQMDFQDGKLVLTLKLMKPSYTLPWLASGGKLRQVGHGDHQLRTIPVTLADLQADDVLWTKTMEIWDKDSSHFVTNSTGTCVSRGDFNA